MNNVKFILTYNHYDYHNDEVKSSDVIRDVASLSCEQASKIIEILLSNLGNYKGEILEVISRYYDIPSKEFYDGIKPIGKTIYFSHGASIHSISPNASFFKFATGSKFFIEIEKPQSVKDAITKYENKLKKDKEQAQKRKIEKAKRALEKQGFKVTKA